MSKWAGAILKPPYIRRQLWDGAHHLAKNERDVSRLNTGAAAHFAVIGWYRKPGDRTASLLSTSIISSVLTILDSNHRIRHNVAFAFAFSRDASLVA